MGRGWMIGTDSPLATPYANRGGGRTFPTDTAANRLSTYVWLNDQIGLIKST